MAKILKGKTASPQTGWIGYRVGDDVMFACSTWLDPRAAQFRGVMIN
jgi:hypothetical protein